MNEKQAKRIRRQVCRDPQAQKLPDVNYESRTVKMRKLRLDGLDKEGKAVYVTWPSITIRLGNCKRRLYQRVKRAISK